MEEDEDVLDAIPIWYCLVQAVAGAVQKVCNEQATCLVMVVMVVFILACMHEVSLEQIALLHESIESKAIFRWQCAPASN